MYIYACIGQGVRVASPLTLKPHPDSTEGTVTGTEDEPIDPTEPTTDSTTAETNASKTDTPSDEGSENAETQIGQPEQEDVVAVEGEGSENIPEGLENEEESNVREAVREILFTKEEIEESRAKAALTQEGEGSENNEEGSENEDMYGDYVVDQQEESIDRLGVHRIGMYVSLSLSRSVCLSLCMYRYCMCRVCLQETFLYPYLYLYTQT